MKKIIEFTGINSGDCEAQCFDVDKETFEVLTNRNVKKYDKSIFNDNTYRYYPFDETLKQGKKYKIKLIIEEL